MRIAVFTWPARLSRFVDVFLELAERGHEIVLLCPTDRAAPVPDALARTGRVTLQILGSNLSDEEQLGRRVHRLAGDYLWHLTPPLRQAAANRNRARGFLETEVQPWRAAEAGQLLDAFAELSPDDLVGWRAALAAAEARLPPDPAPVSALRSLEPDVVLVTPLILAGSSQHEAVKAARELGIPSGFLVFSWDNLTNKGLVHVAPDRTFVWNDVQRREAVELHGLPPASVVVTGAPRWDAFFALRPSLDLGAFCAAHGLDPAHPIVLYLGSSSAVVPDETLVVERWLEALRSSHSSAAEANVLVRPHPREAAMWSGWRPDRPRLALSGTVRLADQSLYDQLHHARAVVALNTSAEIEAAILGTPTFTFEAGPLAPGQRGTTHYRYLLAGEGGVVTHASSLAEHVDQLRGALDGRREAATGESFVSSFVRPRGLDLPVSPILADAIEQLGRRA